MENREIATKMNTATGVEKKNVRDAAKVATQRERGGKSVSF